MNKGIFTIIPAVKKNVAFSDDLVKKLAGVSLIQRSINKALDIGGNGQNICVVTDSEEISLIAKKNGVRVHYNSSLTLKNNWFDIDIIPHLEQFVGNSRHVLWLSPYAPLLTADLIDSAIQVLKDSKKDVLIPVRRVKNRIYGDDKKTLVDLFSAQDELTVVELSAFILFNSNRLLSGLNQDTSIVSYEIEHDLINIETYQDWWVCEKLINRKRIVFRVVGSDSVGMGHIYRALTLSHDITDHEILFVCDYKSSVVANKLAGYEYWLGIYHLDDMVQKIIDLNPDLVINDILSTTESDVLPLQQNGIKVVNFEDLGEGAPLANMTINELYDSPVIDGENILWGNDYFFVRDEFQNAKPHNFSKKVKAVLLAFGGVDKSDLSSKMYHVIRNFCKDRGIYINIVIGPGYKNFSSLAKDVKGQSGVLLTRSTGIISSIMEESQIALVSNGRTVYELAHMNIPSIVISQHERENTHLFSCEENGFIDQGIYRKGDTERLVLESVEKLVNNIDYRHILHKRMERFRFDLNKKTVLKKILKLLESS